jgi:hypothetical protein
MDVVSKKCSVPVESETDQSSFTLHSLGQILHQHMRLLEVRNSLCQGTERVRFSPYSVLAGRPSKAHVLVRSTSFLSDERFLQDVPAQVRTFLGDTADIIDAHSVHATVNHHLTIARPMLDVEWRRDCHVCDEDRLKVGALESTYVRRDLVDSLGPFWQYSTRYEQTYEKMANTPDGVVYVRVRGARLSMNAAQYMALSSAGMLVCKIRVGVKEMAWVLQPHQVETDIDIPMKMEIEPIVADDTGCSTPVKITEWLGFVVHDGKVRSIVGVMNAPHLECDANLKTGVHMQLLLKTEDPVENCLLETYIDLTNVVSLLHAKSEEASDYVAAWVHDGISFEVRVTLHEELRVVSH